MRLIFLANRSESDPLPGLSGPDAGDALFICGDELTCLRLSDQGARAVFIDDSLYEITEEGRIWELASSLSASWYLDLAGRDFTKFQGLSLGGSIEGLFWLTHFIQAYKFIHEASRLLAEEKPGFVLAETAIVPDRKASLEMLCSGAGVALRWLDAPPLRGTRPPGNYHRVVTSWPLSAHQGLRRLLNRVLGFLPATTGKKVAASYYYNIEPLIAALGAHPEVSPVFFDWPSKRLFKLPSWHRWRFMEPDSSPAGLDASARAELEAVRASWQRLSSDPSYLARFVHGKLDGRPAMLKILSSAIEDDLPFLAVELIKLRQALDRAAPDLVVVPFDANPPDRMLVLEARRRGIPSAVIQHGIVCGRRPRILDTQADHLLLGGSAQSGIYASLGLPPERVHDVGYPFLDRYASLRRRPPGKTPEVLLISNMTPVLRNIGSVIKVLRRYSGIRVSIRPHPGEPTALYRHALREADPERFRLAADERVWKLLERASLVVGGPSTVMVEAAILGIPALATDFDRFGYPAPFDGQWGIPLHTDLESLEAALDALLPDRVPERTDYSRLLEAFAGKVDGRGVERGLAVLLGIKAGDPG